MPVYIDGNGVFKIKVGTTLAIGGTDFAFDGPRTIYGVFADRPTPAAAEGAVGGTAIYFASDTQNAYMSSAGSWVAM